MQLMRRILVTGAGGFIGGNSFDRLKKMKNVVCVGTDRRSTTSVYDAAADESSKVYCSLDNEFQVRDLIQFAQPEVIVHCAGKSMVKEDANDPAGITHHNVLATHHLLAHAPDGCRFVYLSSATVYGDRGQNERCLETTPVEPTSVYAATKLAGEALVRAYHALGRVQGFCVRPVATVGKGMTHGLLPALVHKIRREQAVQLLGEHPGSLKPYLHVDDLVDFLLALALGTSDYIRPMTFNIGPQDEVDVSSFAGIVMEEMGRTKPVEWLGRESLWAGDQAVVRVDSHRASTFGWKPHFTTSREAIRAAVREVVHG